MFYEIKKFDQLVGLDGFSEQMIRNHFALYEGYVANTNKFLGLLDSKESGTPEYSEIQRRFGWEWNGMRLHELYFENLSVDKKQISDEGELKNEIDRIYGSIDKWEKNFASVGMMRGIGWVVLYYDTMGKELFSVWINEHDGGHFSGCVPLVVMDVFEHAYMLDYQLKKADYVDSFMKSINWGIVEDRFSKVK